MLSWFDKQQQLLADEITPDTNTVGQVVKEIYKDNSPQGFASGGSVTDPSISAENTDLSLQSRIANLANSGVVAADKAVAGRYDDSPLGTGFYNSPVYITQHYSQMGKFFSGAEPGNAYTNRYVTPQKTNPVASTDPSDFFAEWYNKMRNFAQAREVAGTGEAEVRSGR